MGKKNKAGQIILHLIFIALCACYVLPLMIVIAASFSSETELLRGGFGIFPKAFSLDGYKVVFARPQQIIDSYITTATYSVLNAVLSVVVMALIAYPLVRKNFKGKKIVNTYLLITMLFSGGLVPSYIINARYLHLDDTLWIYVLPSLISAYSVFVIRAGYQGVPEELIEAAKMDGASEWFICFRIMVPLSKATLATAVFFDFVGNWNNWSTSQIYIDTPRLYSLQYLLRRTLLEAEYLQALVDEGILTDATSLMPVESMRYAMMLVAAGPMLVIFPVFQKYFVKGVHVGAVKG